MDRSFPDKPDSSLLGVSVTYWSEPKHKWLIQYPGPCFALIDGNRTKIQPTIDLVVLYRKCLECALSNTATQADVTEYPSLDIGIAWKTIKVYANVPLWGDPSESAKALRDYVESIR